MKVSIITTTYNRPSGLKRVLDGLLMQSKLPDEVIVADDGSTVDTKALIEGLAQNSPLPIIHIRHEDKGFRLSKIRNEAIKKLQADYLIMLDGDCIPNRHFIADHTRLAEKGFFVQGKRVLLKEKASVSFTAKDANSSFYLIRLFLSGSISNSHHLLRIPLLPSIKNTKLKGIKGCNMGFWRDDLIAVNGFNEQFTSWGREDTELAVRLYRYGLKRKEHPFMAICFHLWHPSYPKDTEINDRILEETIKGEEYLCKDGIIKR